MLEISADFIMVKNQSTLLRAIPLLLIIFIDGAGLGLIFPVLNALIIDSSNPFLPVATSAHERHFLYGLICSIFMFCWFFGAAIISDISDLIGRKRAMLMSLIGAFLGYFISGLAIYSQSIGLLILGRVIAGFTAGSQPVAQASIVDICPSDQKAIYLGYALLASSLGFIIGPVIGGLISDSQLVSWFNFTLPMYFAAALAFINIFLLLGLYKETFVINAKVRIRFTEAIRLFWAGFYDRRIRMLSISFFVFLLGWACFYTYIPMFALRQYHFSNLQIALLLALMGLGFSVGMGYLVKLFDRYIDHRLGVIGTLLAAGGWSLLLWQIKTAWILWISVAPIGMLIAIAYVLALTLFSNQVDASRQGWVMGITGSIMAFSFGVIGLLANPFTDANPGLPILLFAMGMGLSSIFFWVLPRGLSKAPG